MKPSVLNNNRDENADNKPESISITLRIPALSFSPTSCTVLLVYNVGFRKEISL
jgi:hypothetical protein